MGLHHPPPQAQSPPPSFLEAAMTVNNDLGTYINFDQSSKIQRHAFYSGEQPIKFHRLVGMVEGI